MKFNELYTRILKENTENYEPEDMVSAIEAADINKLEKILDSGMDVAADNNVALGSAISMASNSTDKNHRKYLDIIQLLLDRGADIRYGDGIHGGFGVNKDVALHIPIDMQFGDKAFSVVKFLVDKGAVANSDILIAAIDGSPKVFKTLLNSRKFNQKELDRTLQHVDDENENIKDMLVKAGAKVKAYKDPKDEFLKLVKQGDAEKVYHFLFRWGITFDMDKALDVAVQNMNVEVAELLLSNKANPKTLDREGQQWLKDNKLI